MSTELKQRTLNQLMLYPLTFICCGKKSIIRIILHIVISLIVICFIPFAFVGVLLLAWTSQKVLKKKVAAIDKLKRVKEKATAMNDLENTKKKMILN